MDQGLRAGNFSCLRDSYPGALAADELRTGGNAVSESVAVPELLPARIRATAAPVSARERSARPHTPGFSSMVPTVTRTQSGNS